MIPTQNLHTCNFLLAFRWGCLEKPPSFQVANAPKKGLNFAGTICFVSR